MGDFLSGLNVMELTFFWSAVAGGVVFLFRLVMQMTGGDHGAGHDVGADASPDIDSSDASFKMLSLEGITAFLTMFGLVGLALAKTTSLNPVICMFGGGLAGLLAMALIGQIFKTMFGLQSSGTLNLNNAIGQEGTVYLTVDPADGGKVEVSVQERLQVFEAITRSGEPIATGTRVKVIEVNAGRLVVEKAS